MTISVSSKTSNSITVACSYPPRTYVPGDTMNASGNNGCTITWIWIWSASNVWLYNTNDWTHNAPSQYYYDFGTGYTGWLDLDSVDQGSRTSPPANPPPGTPPGTLGTTTSSGTAWYSGTVQSEGYYTGADITRTKMYLNGSYVEDGPVSNNFSYTFTGLSQNTTYTLVVQWFTSPGGTTDLGTNSTSGTTNVATPPSAPTGVSGTPVSKSQINLSWNSVSGATGYHLYRNGTYVTTVSGTSYSFTGLSEYTLYTLSVSAYNAQGESSATGGSYRTTDETAPVMVTITTDPSNVFIDVTVLGSDSHSGVAGYWFSINGVFKGTVYGSGAQGYRYTGLTANTEYTITVRCFDLYENSSTDMSVIVKTLTGKPANFVWTYSTISSGANAIVDHRDWNSLTAKINAFRVFKALSTYSFTTVSSVTGDITSTHFNQLIAGVSGLTMYMTNNVMPTTKSYGNVFNASYLNNIVTSINSIT